MQNEPGLINEEIRKRLKGKTVIIGIGNELKGDDAAGPILAKKLAGRISADVLNCEETPENYTGIIKGLAPDVIVIVDAVSMNAAPGSMCIVNKENLNELKLCSTHNLPLKILADYLYSETKADIFLIGIQPESIEFGKTVSRKVENSITHLKELFLEILAKDI